MLNKLNLEKNIQFPQTTETLNDRMDSHLSSVNL